MALQLDTILVNFKFYTQKILSKNIFACLVGESTMKVILP